MKPVRGPREQRCSRGGERGSWPAGRRGRGAGKEGKVAGTAGPRRVWAASALCARGSGCPASVRSPGSLGSAHSALGRTATPFPALPLIDWPACAATLRKLGQAGGTRGRGQAAGVGGARDRRDHAGPGREKTWKAGWIRSGQIHFLGGRTGRAALPRKTRPVRLLPPAVLLGGGEPARRPPPKDETMVSPLRGPRSWRTG